MTSQFLQTGKLRLRDLSCWSFLVSWSTMTWASPKEEEGRGVTSLSPRGELLVWIMNNRL